MPRPRKPTEREVSESMADRIEREDAIAERYRRRPSLRALHESGQIDRQAYEKAERTRAAGPPARPARTLIAASRAERERRASAWPTSPSVRGWTGQPSTSRRSA